MLDFFSMSQRGAQTTIDNDEEEIKNNKKDEHKLSKSYGGGVDDRNYHTAVLH